MSFFEILDITLAVLCVAAYAVKIYLKAKNNVLEVVSELIATAESSGLAGPEKMAQVVEGLYERVPAVLKKFLSKEALQKIAQSIFNWMRKYAETYAEITATAANENEREENLMEASSQLAIDGVADLITELLGLSLAALKEKAKEYEIEVSPKAQKKDIAQAIVVAILNKA